MIVLMALLIAGVTDGRRLVSTFPADTAFTPTATLRPAHNSSAVSLAHTSNISTTENASGLPMMLQMF